MSFKKELLELLLALSPLLVALIVSRSQPTIISRWVGAVLIAATLAVVATGFSMMRFVAKCVDKAPLCELDHVSIPWQAGLIQPVTSLSCFRCVPRTADAITSMTVTMNEWTPRISVVAAAICVLISGLTLVRFARWSKINWRLRM